MSSDPLDPNTLAQGLIRIDEQAFARHDDAALHADLADGFVFHGPDGDATLDHLKELSAACASWTGFAVERRAVPVGGRCVAARTRMSGVFERPFAFTAVGTVPPTGRPVAHDLIT